VQTLIRDVETFGGGQGFEDDVCLVAIESARLPAPTRP